MKAVRAACKSGLVVSLMAVSAMLPVGSAYAELVSTRATMSQSAAADGRARLQAALARADVQRALAGLGVDTEEARQRVAALTDQEVASLQGHIDTLPAGGGVLTVIAVVFIVLIILDLAGVTDIFTFIHPLN